MNMITEMLEKLRLKNRDDAVVAEVPKSEPPPQSVKALPMWPSDTTEDLVRFYGKIELGSDGMPTERWQSSFLTQVTPPYPMLFSGTNGPQLITKITCHKDVAQSLNRILSDIFTLYGGSVDKVREARMNMFDGCYNFRRMTAGSRLSVHSWGAAVDLDASHNPWGKPWKEGCGMMPKEVIQIFQQYGWKWGGEFKRPDAMHFQATT